MSASKDKRNWQGFARSRGAHNFDLYYVCSWSIWLDLYILIRTIRVVLTADGAYERALASPHAGETEDCAVILLFYQRQDKALKVGVISYGVNAGG